MPNAGEQKYTAQELMIVTAAREIVDRDVVFVGVGIPLAAAYLAKITHAPNARIIFESGIVDSVPVDTPLGIADPRLSYSCAKICGLFYALGVLQRGYVDISLLGGAEVDRYGNVNSTAIGDYRTPTVRLPGSGGANDAASHSKRFVVLIPHEKRRLPERVSFVTSPGYIHGPDDRRETGLTGGGPCRVITDLAVMGFHPRRRIMQLESLHPNVPVSEIRDSTGFEVLTQKDVRTTEPPSKEQLKLLRTRIDPHGVYTKKWREL